MTIALLQFDDEEQACHWMQSDPHFRRHDWLDDHDTIVIPMRSELEGKLCSSYLFLACMNRFINFKRNKRRMNFRRLVYPRGN